MNKKNIMLVVIVAVVALGLGYYIGTKHAPSKQAFPSQNGFAGGQGGNRSARGGASGAGFSGGEILSIDATSMTVKGQDGSSKIIFFTQATPVMKMVAGTNSDLVVGKDVTINGTPNPDGSITAESIQMRPAQAGGPTSKTN